MSARETAEMLNMSLTWVYRDAPKMGLKGYKLGRGRNAKIQFDKTDVLKWLDQQKLL
ncbi:helix-turn-helix domain-containing protein [Streptomyces sp. NBRC 110611]|uniref:helix-turn-helix domain-containing protein n=1 Tax=Streptomyces sp. NBRC 110611 TaxID=1621259 RepID=UPI0015EF1696|nr:helix-turn-helix domain-containing protein [Streptomyces sp. NBRC 110611]